MLEKIKQTAEYIRSCVQEIPSTAIILGTGLGALVDHIEDKNSYHIRKFRIFQYLQSKDIPAILSFGRLGNRSVIAMQGRFHYYEGYDMKEVTLSG